MDWVISPRVLGYVSGLMLKVQTFFFGHILRALKLDAIF